MMSDPGVKSKEKEVGLVSALVDVSKDLGRSLATNELLVAQVAKMEKQIAQDQSRIKEMKAHITLQDKVVEKTLGLNLGVMTQEGLGTLDKSRSLRLLKVAIGHSITDAVCSLSSETIWDNSKYDNFLSDEPKGTDEKPFKDDLSSNSLNHVIRKTKEFLANP